MANSELFVLGDARFLSGGAPRSNNTTYNNEPPRVQKREAVTTARLLAREAVSAYPKDRTFARQLLQTCGQSVHCGRDSYHEHEWHSDRCSTRPNIFIADGDVPTAGVEIETYARHGVDIAAMRTALWSNWFHFEEDGSLDRTLGHELITDVLPPRIYRDLRTWTGLQNLTAPWLDSFGHDSTGLHVHVGVQQFRDCAELPCQDVCDRVLLAKLMIAFCYHGLLDATFLDRVFLRKSGSYCASAADKTLLTDAPRARKEGILSGDLADSLYSTFATTGTFINAVSRMTAAGNAQNAVRELCRATLNDNQRWLASGLPQRFQGHGVELNLPHPYTIEFRRGKGTLNAISVHRMVECVTLVVRYVWKACRDVRFEISPRTLYGFIAENTNSNALKTMAEEQIGKLPGKE